MLVRTDGAVDSAFGRVYTYKDTASGSQDWVGALNFKVSSSLQLVASYSALHSLLHVFCHNEATRQQDLPVGRSVRVVY